MKLKLCADLEIPPDAVSRTFGLLAVRGAGKSNAAAVMAEEMFAARLPFVVIDPVGSWYGLRSNATGTGPGLPIPIFGGKHGDIQIDRNAGELLADLVVEKRLSCVLDLSRFSSEADKKYFLLKFAQRLYEKNEDPLHLFLEEADDYIPQKPMRDETHLLRAWENIVRRGRSRGLGMTLITQRSAAINKMVLTQVETLFAMRTTGPQDIAAIEAWVKYHNVKGELLASLSSLPDGDAWIWSPQFLGIMKRVHIRRRHTFDSGATPKNLEGNQSRQPATLADVDLKAINAQMASTIERAKADDPKLLRQEILSLKQEIVGLKKAQPAAKTEVREVSVLTDDDRRLFSGMDQIAKFIQADLGRAETLLEGIRQLCERALQATGPNRAGNTRTSPPVYQRQPAPHKTAAPMHKAVDSTVDTGDLTGPERRILDAIAWLESIGVDAPEQTAVAFLAGYTFGGGAFNNPRGSLRTKGLIEYAGNCVRLTDAGRAAANAPDSALTTGELHRAVMERLPGPEQKILRVLLEAYPDSVANDNCAIAAGYTPDGGAYNNPRGRLRTLGLIDYPERGKVRARDILFLDN